MGSARAGNFTFQAAVFGASRRCAIIEGMTYGEPGSDLPPSRTKRSGATLEVVLVQAAGAAALTVCVLVGLGWGALAASFWLAVYIGFVGRSGLRGVASGRSLLRGSLVAGPVAGVPFLAAATYLAPAVVNPGRPLIALGILAMAVLGGWIGAVVFISVRLRRRGSLRPSEKDGRSGRRIVTAGAVTAVFFSVPLFADAASRSALEDRIRPCGEMSPQLPGASRWMLRILAEACTQTTGQARRPTAQLVVYAGRGGFDVNEAAAAAESIATHLTDHLGPSPFEQIAVHTVAIPGSIRGMAGPGYLLIDREELVSPQDCEAFRSSAGTDGVCGVWVLAHEMAHEWFPGSANLGLPADEVAWEGTADYLAWDWWRQEYGDADASRLRAELFEGRVGLAPRFAASNAPGNPPSILTSSQSRALIYGRGSLGWVAAEEQAGRESVRAVLRSTLERTSGGTLTVGSILRTAEQYPDVAAVLESWWLDRSFEPTLPGRRILGGSGALQRRAAPGQRAYLGVQSTRMPK